MRINQFCLTMFGALNLLISSASATESTQMIDPTRVVGDWVLCQDPDGGDKETIQFMAEGYGFVIASDSPKVPFLFAVDHTQVKMMTNYKGTLMNVRMEHDTSFTKLTLKSPVTGNESFFVRASDLSSHNCTVK